MSTELTAMKTPVAPEDVFLALHAAWQRKFSGCPTRDSVLLLLSHWALETGHGKSMWCYNLGNAKAKVEGAYDYCFFACNEIFKTSVANQYVANSPDTAKITKNRDDGTSIIWFYPKHAACCFRAFTNLNDGAGDYLNLIYSRFAGAWPFVLAGDVPGYCHKLRTMGYYTADEAEYAKAVNSIFATYSKNIPEIVWSAGPFYENLAPLTEFAATTLRSADDEEGSPVWSAYSADKEDTEPTA
jgi:hypothetical protein